MRMAYIATIGCGLTCGILILLMFARPNWFYVLFGSLSFVVLIGTLMVTSFLGIRRWRAKSQNWMVPALACLAFLVAAWFAPVGGRALADWEFRRHIGDFTQAVTEIRNSLSS